MANRIEVKTEKSPAAIGAYSQANKAGNLIMTSGQIPFTAEGELVSEDIEDQVHQSLKNIKHILAEAGADMGQVIKCTIFIDDMEDFPKVNAVYEQYFDEPYPARSCVEVARLPKDVKVEIEAIAMV